jgi:aromatic ring-opening dioxygenase catalytic subunit (LigB family)
MLTSHAFLVPHLPTLVVDQHRGHHTEMLEALAQASSRLLAEGPAFVVVLSARWEAPGPFLVDIGKRHHTITDYTGFGVELRYDCMGHPALGRELIEAGQKAGVHVGPTTRGVDSGVTVPLHFLLPGRGFPVVPLSLARRPVAECREWGRVVRSVLASRAERVGFVVGGLLSHNEHAWNLKREVPEAREFDERMLESLRRGDWGSMSTVDQRFAERARPEAELRHLEVLRGFLSSDVRGEVRCYESGPGVGAALIEFPLTDVAEARRPSGAAGR